MAKGKKSNLNSPALAWACLLVLEATFILSQGYLRVNFKYCELHGSKLTSLHRPARFLPCAGRNLADGLDLVSLVGFALQRDNQLSSSLLRVCNFGPQISMSPKLSPRRPLKRHTIRKAALSDLCRVQSVSPGEAVPFTPAHGFGKDWCMGSPQASAGWFSCGHTSLTQ